MSLYLVRHTTPAIKPGICYGRTDLCLSATAEQEMENVRRRLPNQIDLVFSSPLRRCNILAHRLASTPIRQMAGLCELDFGDWEMQAWDTLSRDALDRWANNVFEYAPPNGEALKSMQQRVLHSWQHICAIHRGINGHTAVITHAGVIRIIHAFEFDWPIERMFEFEIPYGGIVQFSHGDTALKPTLKIL
ncbi:phosphoglycerate mutase [Arenicella chitinivorans]|uniref:Alpha-ribazole phosphatase n=1 Tax=Arenicella chitinivorans TaxID=1329800 RepID=A0A918RMS6_9GAMM|nr:alpha-ribazole phosphatase [Arenicella chitinivorans]GHA02413.1 phosphoglycerate mutase [Arenicella chitinivorans]